VSIPAAYWVFVAAVITGAGAYIKWDLRRDRRHQAAEKARRDAIWARRTAPVVLADGAIRHVCQGCASTATNPHIDRYDRGPNGDATGLWRCHFCGHAHHIYDPQPITPRSGK
jgi:hypothetical protein